MGNVIIEKQSMVPQGNHHMQSVEIHLITSIKAHESVLQVPSNIVPRVLQVEEFVQVKLIEAYVYYQNMLTDKMNSTR
jgi:hypothetical protein